MVMVMAMPRMWVLLPLPLLLLQLLWGGGGGAASQHAQCSQAGSLPSTDWQGKRKLRTMRT